MVRTHRETLSAIPKQINVSRDDNTSGSETTIFVQSGGTLLVCENKDGYDSGSRIEVVQGSVINFTEKDYPIWLASTVEIEVDVIEAGVA